MKWKTYLIAFTIILVAAGSSQAGNVVVIVNPGSALTEATALEIEKVYLGKSSSISGTSVEPVDQPATSDVRTDFSEKLLDRSVKNSIETHFARPFSRAIDRFPSISDQSPRRPTLM